MRKVLIAVIAVMFLVSSAFATSTKVSGANLDTWMTQDDSIVNLLPAQIVNFSKIVYMGYDGDAMDAGANIELGGGVLGMVVVTDDVPYGAGVGDRFALIYGLGLDDSMSLGFGLKYGAYSNKWLEVATDVPENDADDIDIDDNDMELGIVAGLGIAGDMPIDLGVGVAIISDTDNDDEYYTAAGVQTQDDSDITSGIAAQLDARMGMDDMLFNLYFGMLSTSREVIDSTFDGAGDLTSELITSSTLFGIDASLGVVKVIKADAINVTVGLGVSLFTYTMTSGSEETVSDTVGNDSTNSSMDLSIPAVVSAEAKLTENISVRAGVTKDVWNLYTSSGNVKNEDGDVVSASDDYSGVDTDNANMEMGMSLKIGSFTIDANINKDIVLDGPEFIGGDNETLASEIALLFEY